LTTIRFTLSNNITLTSDSLVPGGTLVQTSSGIQFVTLQDGTIVAGTTFVDIPAQAVEAGAAGNGLVAGQISLLVSWSAPFLVAASNTTTSSGGADAETDDHYRARIWMAPESLSTAGPKEAYEYWAASANPDIMDVSIWPNAAAVQADPTLAGKVYVYPLMTGGRLPTTDECAQVYAVCNADNIRPLTDQLFVQAPTVHNYTPAVKYWIKSSDIKFANDIQIAVQAAYADYILWQKTKIGRDINPSQCDERLCAAGAKRTDIPGSTTFVFAALDEKTTAVETASALTYMGLEDE
jgi:phage-related baseplate assembly protein